MRRASLEVGVDIEQPCIVIVDEFDISDVVGFEFMLVRSAIALVAGALGGLVCSAAVSSSAGEASRVSCFCPPAMNFKLSATSLT